MAFLGTLAQEQLLRLIDGEQDRGPLGFMIVQYYGRRSFFDELREQRPQTLAAGADSFTNAHSRLRQAVRGKRSFYRMEQTALAVDRSPLRTDYWQGQKVAVVAGKPW